MKKIVLLASLALAFASCEKDIDLKLNDTQPRLVVEASIENGGYPFVILSRSVNYFAGISPEVLANSFVRNAEVYVSNGRQTHKLKSYTVPFTGQLSGNYYTVDSTNVATAFKGETNGRYSLRVVVDGAEYTAQTTIPALRKKVDSMYWRQAAAPDTAKRNVLAKFTDPPGFGDYVRAEIKVNSGPFLPPFNSAFDDLFIDGTTYDIQLVRGVDRNLRDEVKDYALFAKGDTVTLKLSQIDKVTFEFWQSLEYAYSAVGNPFSTPTKVLSNISNGALGYFGGYNPVYKSVVIAK